MSHAMRDTREDFGSFVTCLKKNKHSNYLNSNTRHELKLIEL